MIKMSEPSIEGLRQAFLDPQSRIRLLTDAPVEPHAQFVAMAWEGGFLDGVTIHFNPNLNVLIGGRGTGKSTVVESIRYVLDARPLGSETDKLHKGIVQHVLKNGTKVSLLVRSQRPSPRQYLIERTVPNPPVVRDRDGNVLPLSPSDVVAEVEVYGQHEISELTRNPDKLTLLLKRFVDTDPEVEVSKGELQKALEQSRSAVGSLRTEISQNEEKLASLPALEERLKRFQEAGVEEQLKEQSLLVSERHILDTADAAVPPFEEASESIKGLLPIDLAFLSSDALKELPAQKTLEAVKPVLEGLTTDLKAIADAIDVRLEQARHELADVRRNWGEREKSVQDQFERIMRKLQRDHVDGQEFLRLRKQVEELRPLQDKGKAVQNRLERQIKARQTLLARWEDAKTKEFRHLERAAKRVSRQLSNRVRVTVEYSGNRQALFDALRTRIGGRLTETIEALQSRKGLSLKEFADSCRAGRDDLAVKFGLPPTQADRLANAAEEVQMQIEELDLPATTRIDLNVAGEGQPPAWQALDDLSTGQKATAVLLLLLLGSEGPLIVDQPEDDLDNRFITDGVVPKMREEKLLRQFVFASHNANIPVLGDAELILGLSAEGEAGIGKAAIPTEHMGSIDAKSVRELVKDILEGGQEAFEVRRLKYGF